MWCFGLPDLDERIALWQSLMPKDAPVTGTLNFEKLSEQYKDMTGANIRNAVLNAAFLAVAEDTDITQAVLERAAKGEYRAMGRLV